MGHQASGEHYGMAWIRRRPCINQKVAGSNPVLVREVYFPGNYGFHGKTRETQ